MTTPTPRTDATCKAIAAMLEPLRGGTRVTDAEMKSVQGVIDALAKCAIDLERDLAARDAELASVKAELAAETAIVDRIWDQLGRPSYEELKGRSIYDLIDALKAELASVKAAYGDLAKHIERIAVRAENMEYEGGYVVSGVSELNEAVDAYRAAHKEGA